MIFRIFFLESREKIQAVGVDGNRDIKRLDILDLVGDKFLAMARINYKHLCSCRHGYVAAVTLRDPVIGTRYPSDIIDYSLVFGKINGN